MQEEMRKLKGGMRGSKLSTRGFIPWFVLPQRHPYIHVVEAPTKSIASGNQVSSVNTITVTLNLLSAKELLHRGWGSPRPPHKIVDAAPHQAGGSSTCRQASNAPRGWHTEIHLLVHPRTMHKAAIPSSFTHLIANLALTLSKMC